jgi:hypothetical protein
MAWFVVTGFSRSMAAQAAASAEVDVFEETG